MNLFRFVAVMVLLSSALTAQAGVMPLDEHPRFHLYGFEKPRLQQERDWGHFLPAQHGLQNYLRLLRNWRVNLPGRGHGPGHPKPPVVEIPPVVEVPPVQPPTTPVFEPPVAGLMVLGLAGLFGARWRMRQALA